MTAARLVATACVLLLAIAGTAAAAAPRASVTDLEDEVMCPICGTLLELSTSPQAERERAFIGKLVREGLTKGQIEDALVAEYGPEVLAEPSGSGFDLSAYVVPAVAFAIAAAALGAAAWRWRARSRAAPEAAPAAPSDEESARLEADLAKYDL